MSDPDDERTPIDRSQRECTTTAASDKLERILARARAASERTDDELRAEATHLDASDRFERLISSGVRDRLDARGLDAITRDRMLDTDALRIMRTWLHPSCSRPALFLTSIPGQGKTVASAWALANLVVPDNEEYAGRYFTLAGLCKLHSKAQGGNAQGDAAERELNAVLASPLLVLDELGRELDAARGALVMHEVLDRRQWRSRMTIITTNLNKAALVERYDAGILDRLGVKSEDHGIALMYALKSGPSLRERPEASAAPITRGPNVRPIRGGGGPKR